MSNMNYIEFKPRLITIFDITVVAVFDVLFILNGIPLETIFLFSVFILFCASLVNKSVQSIRIINNNFLMVGQASFAFGTTLGLNISNISKVKNGIFLIKFFGVNEIKNKEEILSIIKIRFNKKVLKDCLNTVLSINKNIEVDEKTKNLLQ